jgi:hypothetical protein
LDVYEVEAKPFNLVNYKDETKNFLYYYEENTFSNNFKVRHLVVGNANDGEIDEYYNKSALEFLH